MSRTEDRPRWSKGTTAPETKPARPLKTSPKGRRCEVCRIGLSIYNPKDTCFQHQKPQRFGGGPRRQRQKP